MRKGIPERQSAVCPHCMEGALTSLRMNGIFCCSNCGSIYRRMSVSSRLERLEAVSDISSYPEISVQSLPYCDCKLRMIWETGGCLIRPRYCLIHNVIVIEGIFEPEDLETIPEWALEVINHETLHWVLCKKLGESVSNALDTDSVLTALEWAPDSEF